MNKFEQYIFDKIKPYKEVKDLSTEELVDLKKRIDDELQGRNTPKYNKNDIIHKTLYSHKRK